MVGVDLFAGAGGLTLGAKEAGIDVQLAVECDPHSVATYNKNHPDVNLIFSDIRRIKTLPIKKFHKQTIIFGGPPCQGFSTSNQRTRSASNEKNWLFLDFLRLLKRHMPEWVVFENVKGILETEKGIFFKNIISKLSQLGYKVTYGVLNAVDFYVPQFRNRLFVIGSLNGLQMEMPNPARRKHVSVGEAISDLPDIENGSSENWRKYKSRPKSEYALMTRGNLIRCANHLVTKNAPHIIERFKHIPQGGNWVDIPEELMQNYTNRNQCHTGIYHRLRADRPASVIGNYRKNMLIHPYQDRGLSVREAARLQSFPDQYEFVGSIGFQQQQVGNAVPPLLAKAVFEAILKI